MNDSPQAIRERVHAEELARGSDPRVAEGRAKAAEARARHGFPIEPQEAWKAKLEKEGGGAPASTTAAPAATEQATPAVQEATETTTADAQAPEAQQPAAHTAPEPVAPPTALPAAPEVLAPPPYEIETAASLDAEVGETIVTDESIAVIGSIAVRDAPMSRWLVALLAALALWGAAYLIVLSGSDVNRATTGCEVSPNQDLTCFLPRDGGSPAEAAH